MKNQIGMAAIAFMALMVGVRADVLVGWDFEGSGDSPSYTSAAISTDSILTGFTFDGAKGSADGTWGNSTATPAPVNLLDNATKFKGASSIQDLTLIVNAGGEVTLSELNFDYSQPFSGSPNDFTLSYLSGDLDDAGGVTLFSFVDGAVVTTMTGVDIDLTASLTDLTLTGGQSATFRFDYTSDKTGAAFIDNIAIQGSVDAIPEPATMGLMGVFGGIIMTLRRKFSA